MSDQIKLHKRTCRSRIVGLSDDGKSVAFTDGNCNYVNMQTYEIVGLWYQFGELLGIDVETAKEILEQIHWRDNESI